MHPHVHHVPIEEAVKPEAQGEDHKGDEELPLIEGGFRDPAFVGTASCSSPLTLSLGVWPLAPASIRGCTQDWELTGESCLEEKAILAHGSKPFRTLMALPVLMRESSRTLG